MSRYPKWVYRTLTAMVVSLNPIAGIGIYGEFLFCIDCMLYSQLAFFIVYVVISLSLLCLFIRPLIDISNRVTTSQLVNEVGRFTLLALFALVSTSFYHFIGLFSFGLCRYRGCPITWVYWFLEGPNSGIDLICLVMTLKGGKHLYSRYCRMCHECSLACLGNRFGLSRKSTSDRFLSDHYVRFESMTEISSGTNV